MKKKYAVSILLTSIMSVYPFMNHGNSLNSTSIVHAQSNGWQKNNGTWYYYNASGVKQTGWLKEGNTWYYLKPSGAMATGWEKVNGTWYYLKPSGAMATGWEKVNGTWYYLGTSGAMKTGWLKEGNTWYYLKSSGAMATGWEKVNGTWYYLGTSGAMKTGWLKEGNTWYYFKPSGAMATGWENVNGMRYYFYNSGEMATNTTIDGWEIDYNGIITGGAVEDTEKPSVDEPTVDEPSVDEPTVEEPTVEEPSVDEPTVEEPSVDEPTVEEPSVDEPSVDEPTVDEPTVEEPTDDTTTGTEDDSNTVPEIDEDQINNVMELIAGIGDNITFDDNQLLESIQKEYASLNAEEKQLVTNYSKFESAQIKMNDIKKQIDNVYNLIGMIPEEITIDNLVEAENKVAQAEAAYNSLPEESKKGIPSTTYSIMVFSRDAITRLKNSIEYANDERVLAIQEKIEQLPVLTNADMSDYDTVKNADIAIKAVVDEYVNLPQELQHAVNNREKLDQAYEKVRYLKAKIIEKEIASIDLDTVTEDDKPKLIALRDAFFNDLDKIGQALVENYPHLIAAINKLATNK